MTASKKNEPIIEVKNISKQYNIGVDKTYKTLSGSLTSAMKHPLEVLKDGRKSNNIFWALKDLNFEVDRGEVLGIIGRNGAGKSTLLKILSRITHPTEGEIRMRGRVGSLLEVGTGFHPELSGRENIYFNGAILGMKKREIDDKFEEIVKFSGIEKFLDTPVKRYSSGMNVRLAFSVAAHLDPEILLVDEVLAVGDAEFQKKCLGKMKAVSESGRTVLFVSHNMNAIENLCTRAILLNNGKFISESYEPREIINEYLNSDCQTNKNCIWLNRKNEFINPWFTLEKIYFTDESGNIVDDVQFSNKTNHYYNLVGDIKELDPALEIGYVLYDDNDNLLYTTYFNDDEENKWPKLSEGKFCFSGIIPKRFLNEGLYRVEPSISMYSREWIIEPGVNAPSLNFEIRGGLSNSPYWLNRRPGVMAPFLKWSVNSTREYNLDSAFLRT
jgi:lipopolysaccharide transport system ATP-binding protein